ncbi:aminotransferase DegT [miscellaneous Crenarchaeota group archaeon SMTZ-80]|nr:MAG: aminotransferase DegT [miscellaneous Crenarchaeota group archaeon SMTZ-80]
MFERIIHIIRQIYKTEEFIPLHVPRFIGNEKKYLNDCIDSTYVSSVGAYVERFELMTASYTGAEHAIVCVNGTEALHLALLLIGVTSQDEVATQPLTFIATANAISYTGAKPLFIDIDKETIGFSPAKFRVFLEEYGDLRNDGYCYNRITGSRIAACVPMHTFGHPVKMDELLSLCRQYHIAVIEDAAESIGSKYKGTHTGTIGTIGILSFNGNKIITTGGGGMLLTNNDDYAIKAKHLTTQAKVPHRWEYIHDQIGFNYRMPNINAALGCAQIENIDFFIKQKRSLAKLYYDFLINENVQFFCEPEDCESNYWLNTIIFSNRKERDDFLEFSNSHNVMTRPAWRLMNKLNMYKDAYYQDLSNAEWMADRIVNIPSSVIL